VTKNSLLLVDDEPSLTALFKRGLEMHGFKVDAFNDPLKALSRYRPNYYDTIILDVRMPNMTGFGLAKEIWSKDPDARICFLSAFEIYEHESRSVFTNFRTHCFIKKPITPSALVEHIHGHLVPAY
jgi:DNA-binding response OmpR family regulator